MNQQIENNRKSKGFYLPSEGETCFKTLDGSDTAEWLRGQGYKVLENGDTGGHGYALTECGVYVSTNGRVSFK